jgi:hypothetical protein
MLRAKAALAPSPQLRPSVIPAARRRRICRLVAVTVPIAAALSVAAIFPGRPPADAHAFAAFTLRDTPRLRGDTPTARQRPATDDTAPHQHASPGEPITRAMLERNVRCMRAHGFDLPEPVETQDGWQVIVEDGRGLPSESPDSDVRKRWAEAVFVECRLIDAAEELVLGGRTRKQVEHLMACARARGFVLRVPTETRPGEFVFDLDAVSPPWGSEAWYRIVFVACGA